MSKKGRKAKNRNPHLMISRLGDTWNHITGFPRRRKTKIA